MIHLMALMLAAAASPIPSPAPAASAPSPYPTGAGTPIPTASPEVLATPQTHDLVLPPVPAIAPGFTAPQQQPPSGDIAGVTGPFVGISLDSAVAMTLARNTSLSISQENRRIAAFSIVAAAGAYDVRFVVQPKYALTTEAPLSPFNTGPNGTPITEITAGAQAGFAGQLGTGGNFQLSTTAQRVNNTSVFNSYDPYYQTALALTFSQPLARGRAIDDIRRQIRIAAIDADLSTDNALQQASMSVAGVLDAYFNLIAAWKNVGIQEDALRQAQSQAESNQRLVRRGAAAAVDVVESNTQVNEFGDNVFSAIQNVATYQNTLKGLLLNDPADPLWTANLVPTSPISTFVTEPSVDSVLVAALKNRPEVAQLRENIRIENVNLDYAKDQTRPQIDLNVGVTENGFAGAALNPNSNPFVSVIGAEINAINALIARVGGGLVPISGSALEAPLFPGTVGGIGQSYGTALQGKFPQYSISATLGFPIKNRVAEANYSAEIARRRSLETQEVAVIERLQVESRNAVQQYRSARSRLSAASAARGAAEQVAASELRRFRAGASTTFLVLQRQVNLANQRNRELQAQSDVQKALVELDRVTGNILANNGVDLTTLGKARHGAVPDLLAPANSPNPQPSSR